MELHILTWTVALGLIQLMLTVAVLASRQFAWATGPRDTPGRDLGKIGGRLERAFRNFLETFALFAAAVLVDRALGRSTPITQLGAELYFWARLLYVPAYVAGVPFARTVVWGVSFAGIIMVLSAAWTG